MMWENTRGKKNQKIMKFYYRSDLGKESYYKVLEINFDGSKLHTSE